MYQRQLSFPLDFRMQISGDAEVRAKIEGVSQAVNQFNSAVGGTASPVTNAGNAIQQMGALSSTSASELGNSGNALNQFGSTAEVAGAKSMTAGESARKLGSAFQSSVGSITAFSGGVIGLWENIDNLQRAEFQAGRAHLMLEKSQTSLANATEKLNKMREEGGHTANEMAKQEELVSQATEKVDLAQQRNELTQNNLNQTYANFATQILPSVMAIGGSAVQMFTNLSANSGKLKDGISGLISSFAGFGGGIKNAVMSLVGFGAAATTSAIGSGVLAAGIAPLDGLLGATAPAGVAAAAGIEAEGLSAKIAAVGTAIFAGALGVLRAAFAALSSANPILLAITIAIAAVSAIMIAIKTNAWGFRDAMNGLGKAIGDAVPPLRGFLDAVKSTVEWMLQINEADEKVTEGYKKLGESQGLAGKALDDFVKGMQDNHTEMERARLDAVKLAQQNGDLALATKLVNMSTDEYAAYLKTADAATTELASSVDDLTTASQKLHDAQVDNVTQAATYLRTMTDLTSVSGLAGDEILALAAADQKLHSDSQSVLNDQVALVTQYTSLDVAAKALADGSLPALAGAIRNAVDEQNREAEAQKAATEEIKRHTDENYKLATSYGVVTQAQGLTTDQQDRYLAHIRDLESEYNRARADAESFAVVHGVTLVNAVKASDSELQTMIRDLPSLGKETRTSADASIKALGEASQAYAPYRKEITDTTATVTTETGKQINALQGVQTKGSEFEQAWAKQWGLAGASATKGSDEIAAAGKTLEAVSVATTKLSVVWIGHALSMGSSVDKIAAHLDRYAVAINSLNNIVRAVTSAISSTWAVHVTAVGSFIVRVSQFLLNSQANYNAYRNGVNALLVQLSLNWATHATAIGMSLVRIGQSFMTSAQNYAAYRNGVQQTLTTLNAAWNASAAAIAAAASKISSSITAMATSIVSSDNRAISSLQSLQSQINSMHGTSITNTVTTENRTTYSSSGSGSSYSGSSGSSYSGSSSSGSTSSGSTSSTSSSTSYKGFTGAQATAAKAAGFAKGGSFIVDRPTPIIVGEEGRELVNVTPINGGSDTSAKAIHSLIGDMGGNRKTEVVIISPVYIDGKEIARATRRYDFDGLGAMK